MKTSPVTLFLSSPDFYDKVYLFDPERLTYEICLKSVKNIDNRLVSGMASIKEGHFLAFYKYRDTLWLVFGSNVYPVTESLTSNWSMEKWKPMPKNRLSSHEMKVKAAVFSRRTFQLIHNGSVVEDQNYVVVENDPDTRPFVIWDDEDEDFLLWMHNMLHSLERKNVALNNWH